MVSVSLSSGETKTIQCPTGLVEFKIKLVDVHNTEVEIHKCVQIRCDFHDLVYADSHGVITFKDMVSGLSTIQYRFIINNNVFAKLNVIPQVIDVNQVVNKTTSLLETIFLSIASKMKE